MRVPCMLLKNSQMRAQAKLITGSSGLAIKVPDWVFPQHQPRHCTTIQLLLCNAKMQEKTSKCD